MDAAFHHGPQDLAEGSLPFIVRLTHRFLFLFVELKGKWDIFHISLQTGFTPAFIFHLHYLPGPWSFGGFAPGFRI